MFYYYGAKNQLRWHYPAPQHNLIIEPFAGSAAYSCHHLFLNRNLTALLIEKDNRVVKLWKQILSMRLNDLKNYPVPKLGDHTDDFFIMTCATSNATARCKKLKYTKRIEKIFKIQRTRLIRLFPIRSQIQIICGSYETIKNQRATWFIDPPYSLNSPNKNTLYPNGDGYRSDCGASSLNYKQLSIWCQNRRGQVIVCEKNGASWMPFKLLRNNKNSLNKVYKELIWIK